MHNLYILDENLAPVAVDVLTWGTWMATADRCVARTEVGTQIVSTVFLAVDHNFHELGLPILYETIVFNHGGGYWTTAIDYSTVRYATRGEALSGHMDTVRTLTEQPQAAADLADLLANVKGL